MEVKPCQLSDSATIYNNDFEKYYKKYHKHFLRVIILYIVNEKKKKKNFTNEFRISRLYGKKNV